MDNKWTRRAAGWYVTDGFEIESVSRMGGGGDAGEWLLFVRVTPDKREWHATYPSARAAKEAANLLMRD